LFKENYKNWFRCIRVKIKRKRVYYSIELSRTEYIWIYRKGKAAGVNREGKTGYGKNNNNKYNRQ